MMKRKFRSDRGVRGRRTITPARLAGCRTTVVGLAALGRQVAFQLTALEVPWLQLIDARPVRSADGRRDGYPAEDVNRHRVHATADLCHQMNPRLELYAVARRFQRRMDIGNVVFCCVDSAAARQRVWKAARERTEFAACGETRATELRVMSACNPTSRAHCSRMLAAAADGQDSSWSGKFRTLGAAVGAALMVLQFGRFLRGQPVYTDLRLDLATMRLVAGESA